MQYKVLHRTSYEYQQVGALSYNEAWLTPRQLPHQNRLDFELNISPQPSTYNQYQDHFQNEVTYFDIQAGHKDFIVEAISRIDRSAPHYLRAINSTTTWELYKEELERIQVGNVNIKEFTLFSPLVPYIDSIKNYVSESFNKKRSLFHAIEEVNHRIYQDFEYDPGFTTIATPLKKVAAAKKGVCQDFAHIAIAGLRAMGIPTRYVSGYIETLPPEGAPELVGSAASHAWFSSYIPEMGWVDFDPTNNQMVKDQHITLAWGRDYADVPPLKGVIRNSGSHDLSVEVEVIRI